MHARVDDFTPELWKHRANKDRNVGNPPFKAVMEERVLSLNGFLPTHAAPFRSEAKLHETHSQL